MKVGDIVKLKNDFEEELNKLGFCSSYSRFVSMGFKNGSLKIQYIRHEDEHDIDIAMFSPFLECPVQCLELVKFDELYRNHKNLQGSF